MKQKGVLMIIVVALTIFGAVAIALAELAVGG